jgi:hypothetical protein
MGTNTGLKTVYDVEGAGTYNYTDTGGGIWHGLKIEHHQ